MRENDENEIARLEEDRYGAMLDKDVAILARRLDDDLVYMHSSGVADTKESYIRGLRDGAWDYHLQPTLTTFYMRGTLRAITIPPLEWNASKLGYWPLERVPLTLTHAKGRRE